MLWLVCLFWIDGFAGFAVSCFVLCITFGTVELWWVWGCVIVLYIYSILLFDFVVVYFAFLVCYGLFSWFSCGFGCCWFVVLLDCFLILLMLFGDCYFGVISVCWLVVRCFLCIWLLRLFCLVCSFMYWFSFLWRFELVLPLVWLLFVGYCRFSLVVLI